jgi:invasion protein IalB
MFTRIIRSTSLGLAITSILAAHALAQDPPAQWQTEVIHDPMHKGGSIALATQHAQAANGDRLEVQVRCWSATREFDVRFVRPDGRFATEEVRWQVDRARVVKQTWRFNYAKDALVVPANANDKLIKLMRSARTLTFWSGPSDQSGYPIPLAGSSAAFAEIELMCGK